MISIRTGFDGPSGGVDLWQHRLTGRYLAIAGGTTRRHIRQYNLNREYAWRGLHVADDRSTAHVPVSLADVDIINNMGQPLHVADVAL